MPENNLPAAPDSDPVALIDELLAVPHDTCEDGYYSCPKSGRNPDASKGNDCYCGKDERDEKLRLIRTAVVALLSQR